MIRPPRFWYSRGYLPHFDCPGMVQAVTFRLADSLPSEVISEWRVELGKGDPKLDAELRRRITRWEDAGHGDRLLGKAKHALLVEETLLHFDGDRYRLLDWCIMPNHVHVLICPIDGETLDRIVKSWKSFTARRINEAESRTGALWARDYHDRYIRDEEHLADARRYIWNNPVRAGLCERAEGWRFGSAWEDRGVDRKADRPEPFGPV